MPLDTLPTSAKIVELQLSIGVASNTKRRPLDKGLTIGAPMREIWQGAATFATMAPSALRALTAWLAARDGRAGAFLLPLKQGFATHANTVAGTCAAASSGASSLAVTLAANATIRAGTLLSVGAQIVEVLDDATCAPTGTLNIAPRIRAPLANGTSVVGGDILLPVSLISDELDTETGAAHGTAGIRFIEAVS